MERTTDQKAILVRDANEGEFRVLVDIFLRAVKTLGQIKPQETEKDIRCGMMSYFNGFAGQKSWDERTRILVAEQGEKLLGFGCSKGSNGEESVAEIDSLYIDPESQKSGVGRVILTNLLENLRKIGPENGKVILWADRTDASLAAFYGKMGWTPEEDQTKDYLGARIEHMIRYFRNLD